MSKHERLNEVSEALVRQVVGEMSYSQLPLCGQILMIVSYQKPSSRTMSAVVGVPALAAGLEHLKDGIRGVLGVDEIQSFMDRIPSSHFAFVVVCDEGIHFGSALLECTPMVKGGDA